MKMGLRDIEATLPPGFRFYPSDEELICHYLYKKISNEEVLKGTLVEIDLHTCEPWQLPEVAQLNSNEWYFFNFRDRKYATGYRANRATAIGYWKATGKDRVILDPRTQTIIGMRKTLVFYKNRAPNGIKTGWIMHEFRLENRDIPPKEDWVLCRVFHKSKGENTDKFMIRQNGLELEKAAGAGSDTSHNYNLARSPPTDLNCVYQHQYQPQMITTSCSSSYQGHSTLTSNTLLSLSSSNPNPSFCQAANHAAASINGATTYSNKCEDEYEFLLDMMRNLDENTTLGNHGGVPNSTLEDMKFEV